LIVADEKIAAALIAEYLSDLVAARFFQAQLG